MKVLLKNIEKNTRIPILSGFYVKDGRAMSTDCDIDVFTACPLDNGVYMPQLYKAGIAAPNTDLLLSDAPNPQEFNAAPILAQFDGITLESLEFISRAMSKEETRYYLNGVFFGRDHIVATDGHRMHGVTTRGAIFANDDLRGFILPAKAVKLAIDAMKECKLKSFSISFTELKARFIIGHYEFVSKLIDGTFPDYKRVIPENAPQGSIDYVHFSADKMKAESKKLLAAADKRARIARFEDGKVTCGVYSCDSGFVPPFPMAFNLSYFLDAMIDGAAMHFKFFDSPVKFVKDDYFSVIMPLRLPK